MSRIRLLGLVTVLVVVLIAASQVIGWPGGSSEDARQSDPGATPGAAKARDGEVSEVLPGSDPGSGASPQGEDLARDAPQAAPGELLPGLDSAPPRTTGALVSRLPRDAARRGGLVAGYPARALPAVPASAIRSSSVSTAGRRVQVALVATTTKSGDTAALFYRQSLGRLGFRESDVAAVDGSTGLAFHRGSDHVVVTITASGRRGCTYSLFGTLAAGRG